MRKMNKMNGSVEKLASALAEVLHNAQASALEANTKVQIELSADMEKRFTERFEDIDNAIATTNQNTSAQFAAIADGKSLPAPAAVFPRKKSGRRARAKQRK